MSEIITDLIKALTAVRNDYNERLKTVPQYEAFLSVESSTQKAFDALCDLLGSAKPSMAAEVMASLQHAKSKFKQHLGSVAEYRALLAVDKLIGEVTLESEAPPVTAQTAVVTSEPAPEIAAAQPAIPAPPEPVQTSVAIANPFAAMEATATLVEPVASEVIAAILITAETNVAEASDPEKIDADAIDAEAIDAETIDAETIETSVAEPAADEAPPPDATEGELILSELAAAITQADARATRAETQQAAEIQTEPQVPPEAEEAATETVADASVAREDEATAAGEAATPATESAVPVHYDEGAEKAA